MTEGGKKRDSLTASVPVTLPVTELLSEMFSCPNSQRASAVLMVVKKRVHNLNNHDCSESETAAATPQGFRHSCNMTLTGFEMFTVPCKLELSLSHLKSFLLSRYSAGRSWQKISSQASASGYQSGGRLAQAVHDRPTLKPRRPKRLGCILLLSRSASRA